jgi:tripartite-type tricarboxylate transporter receptor subunit TctC
MRIVAHRLSEQLGRSVVVDNRTGAVGAIALDLASRAVPDGYTLMICSTQNFTAMLLKTVATDIPRTLTPVALLGATPYLLVTTPALPVASVRELKDYAKNNALVYASSGVGSAVHLAMELFKSMAGIEMTHVPYKGSSQILPDLLDARIDMALDSLPVYIPHLKSGKLRALAVASRERSTLMPELPTMAEAGVPGVVSATDYALYAPAGTPKEIVARLNRETNAALQLPDLRAKLAAQGIEISGSTPEEMQAELASEIAKWAQVIRNAGIKPE